MAIKVGTVNSIGRPQNWRYEPDDRQELVQTVGGVIVEDYGHIANGDKYSCSALFTTAGANTVIGYWDGRTLVDVQAQDGTIYEDCRVLIRGITQVRLHERKYKMLDLEFWRI